ncbi:insulinase family protein [Sphingomonas gilva]|uniref:Insulinase family protein n=1 Tax=Sphingomonas gilva TaxID=2305907 RepID=A0A396RP21_9SPHN|nr:M16 family metallopeptidase [Sphingomonas gilva]RHW18274.1 insulinase family protein [Sphingomonas gilva]
MRLTSARFALASALALSLAFPLSAQTAPAPAPAAQVQVDRSPWLYKGSDLPQDKAWIFGALPNGLRYAVRRNGVPPGQVSVRVRVDAGSLMETDAERGFAHLIEHLSFRGSEFVPDGEAKRIWQRLGVTFGADSNAQTSPTQTVYKLDLPAATPAGFDESMKILSGMVDSPGLSAAALDAERPVVLAEQREQPGPQRRVGDATRGLFFAGQPLAERSPIGTAETLTAATPAAVKAFHDRWYRPDRTVVIIAGDIDPALMEAAIVRHFADWRPAGPAPAEPDFGKPDPEARTSAALVEPAMPPTITLATLRPWQYNDDTAIFNQKRIVDLLAIRLINRRLERRARAGGSYLAAGAELDDVSRSVNATFVNIQPLGEDWEPALRDVRVVIADAMTNPPTQAEIDREVAEIDAAMKASVDTAPVEAGAKQADDMVQALDIRETVTTPQAAYEILQDMKRKKMFTPEAVLASSKKVFAGAATRAMIVTPTPSANAEQRLNAVLAEDVTGLIQGRKAAADVSFDQLPRFGKPGKVTSRSKVTELGIDRISFANGVNLLLWPTSAETGRVYVRVRFGRGYQALPKGRESAAWAADYALVQSGIGKIDQNGLEALTTARRIGMDFAIDDDAFELSAMTSAEDLADQLKLLAAKLVDPGWDPNPVIRARAAAIAGADSFDSAPAGVLARDLERLIRGGDPRWGTPGRETIARLTPEAFRALWEPLLKTGPIEVMVFGDVKAEPALAAVAATFGAMKPRQPAPVPPGGASVAFPAPNTTPEIRYHKGPETQAAAVIAWPTGGGSAGIAEGRKLQALSALFSDRLLDRLRSQEGASYSPQVISDWPVGLDNGGRIMAVGLVAPDKTDLFFRLAREIAADLAANPITRDELRRVMAPLMQQVARSSTGNSFWLRELEGGTFDPARIAAADTIARDYGTVTPADLQALAVKYLQPGKDWSFVVLPTPAKEGE